MISNVLKILEDLVKINTVNPPGDKGRYEEIINEIQSYLPKNSDIKKVKKEGIPSLIATKGRGKKHIVFNGHLDVVPVNKKNWSRDPFSMSIDNGRVYGRGVSDMKGGLAALIQAFREFDPDKAKVTLIANADEETGGRKGILELKKKLNFKSFDFWIVAEPTLLQIHRCEKGAYWFKVTARGKSAHGSRPSNGINAIDGIAELIMSLKDIFSKYEKKHPLLGRPTLNTGVIKGGNKTNIVAGECKVWFDRRTLPKTKIGDVKKEIHDAVSKVLEKRDLSWSIESILEADSFEFPEINEFVQICSKAVEKVTGKPSEISGLTGFTDGRVPAKLGIPTVILGPGDMNESHASNESASIKLIETSVNVYKTVLGFLTSPDQ